MDPGVPTFTDISSASSSSIAIVFTCLFGLKQSEYFYQASTENSPTSKKILGCNAIQVFSKERNKATNIVKAYTSVCQIWQPYFFFTKVGIFLLLDKQREFHTLLFEALQNLVKYNFSLVPILWMREFQERKRPRLESRPFGQRPRGLSIYQAA